MAETGGLFVIDAETGDISQFTSVTQEGSNTFTADVAAKNNGTYGFKLLYDGTNEGNFGLKSVAPQSDIYLRFYIYIVADSRANGEFNGFIHFKDSGEWALDFRFYRVTGGVGYRLWVNNGGAGIINRSGNLVISDATWTRFEIRYLQDAVNGGCQVWINGVSDASSFITNTSAYDVTEIGIGTLYGQAPDLNDTIYLDDIKADTSY
ncbi:hypothetical protein LCGC14_2813650, partial [marine sediment metagenome]